MTVGDNAWIMHVCLRVGVAVYLPVLIEYCCLRVRMALYLPVLIVHCCRQVRAPKIDGIPFEDGLGSGSRYHILTR